MRAASTLLVAGALGLAGAPSAAEGPSVAAHATFEIGFSTEGAVGRSMTQHYRIGESDDPERSKSVKLFSWGGKKPKTIALVAGRPVFVFATLKRLFGAPGISASGSDFCTGAGSFVPQPGKRYRVMQSGSPSGPCPLVITEIEEEKD